MKNYTQHRNYTLNGGYIQQVIKLPGQLDDLIPGDDSVRLVSQILEELDYSRLHMAYSSKGRKYSVNPIILFKILIYSYMNNIYSSRKIEQACRRDINFMWLLNGYPVPDHNTIARFRTERLEGVLDDLFNQFIEILHNQKEVVYETLFVDGTKIEANANKYTFVWKKAVEKSEKRMKENIKEYLEYLNQIYHTNFIFNEETVKSLTKIMRIFKNKCKAEKVKFVYGKGNRKTELQKVVETLSEYIERQKGYDYSNKKFNGRNSYSKTDPDATFMHMKEDHMRNSQLKPGYNVQIGVEAEYIVGVKISAERNDANTLIPFMKSLNTNLSEKFKKVVADAGYESEENYLFLKDNNQLSYIKPVTYKQIKTKKFKTDISKRENMTYIKEEDMYICYNQRKLSPVFTRHRETASGYIRESTVYECEDCNNCEYKEKCTKRNGNKRIEVSKTFNDRRKESLENILTPEGIELRINRSIQAEGAFGVMKADYEFRQFLTRGKSKVETEIKLLCFGYNVNKLHSKIQNNRCGEYLHNKKTG